MHCGYSLIAKKPTSQNWCGSEKQYSNEAKIKKLKKPPMNPLAMTTKKTKPILHIHFPITRDPHAYSINPPSPHPHPPLPNPPPSSFSSPQPSQRQDFSGERRGALGLMMVFKGDFLDYRKSLMRYSFVVRMLHRKSLMRLTLWVYLPSWGLFV
jgi:hypothetical protein